MSKDKATVGGSFLQGAEKLLDKVALITGDDSCIGRAIAVLYACEGRTVAFVFLPE